MVYIVFCLVFIIARFLILDSFLIDMGGLDLKCLLGDLMPESNVRFSYFSVGIRMEHGKCGVSEQLGSHDGAEVHRNRVIMYVKAVKANPQTRLEECKKRDHIIDNQIAEHMDEVIRDYLSTL